MSTGTARATVLIAATRLIPAMEAVIVENAALVAEMEGNGVTFPWLDGIAVDLERALTGVRALAAVGGNLDAYLYWSIRVYMRATLDEQRSESGWERFEAFHRRFEVAFPDLAIELAREAHWASVTGREPDPDLAHRALAAIALIAGGPA